MKIRQILRSFLISFITFLTFGATAYGQEGKELARFASSLPGELGRVLVFEKDVFLCIVVVSEDNRFTRGAGTMTCVLNNAHVRTMEKRPFGLLDQHGSLFISSEK